MPYDSFLPLAKTIPIRRFAPPLLGRGGVWLVASPKTPPLPRGGARKGGGVLLYATLIRHRGGVLLVEVEEEGDALGFVVEGGFAVGAVDGLVQCTVGLLQGGGHGEWVV